MDVLAGGIVFVLALIGLVIIVDCVKKELQMLFKKKRDKYVTEAVKWINESDKNEDTKNEETKNEETKSETVKTVDEWIWVEGYKATDKDMQCRGYQYTLGELHNMPNEIDIKECESGFHLCKKLTDVFHYYKIGNGNRFFKVRALVRKSHYERYGKETEEYFEHLKRRNENMFITHFWGQRTYDKMAARSIIFEQELTPDEILAHSVHNCSEWEEKYKLLALQIGTDLAFRRIQTDTLVELGYSDTFARLIIDSKKYDIAKYVGSQSDLSMDMKCWLIFK